MEIQMKRCPYCQEEISADALKCRYCGEFLEYQQGAPKPAAPQNYLVWAILATVFCCMPFGVASIIFATRVDSAYARGEYEEAQKASKQAMTWMLVSVISAIVGWILYMIFFFGVIGLGALGL